MNTLVFFATDADIHRIGRGLLDRTLPKSEWTHAAHFAATIWVIAARPDLVPARDIPPAIRAYNEATGGRNTDTEGYHETITQASIRAATHHVATHPGLSLAESANALLASRLGDKNWLLDHWSESLLFSPAARAAWVAPDRAPLPY